MDKAEAKDYSNRITGTGKAVAFPANLKVYTGGKAPGVDKWLVYARTFENGPEGKWEFLETEEQIEAFYEPFESK